MAVSTQLFIRINFSGLSSAPRLGTFTTAIRAAHQIQKASEMLLAIHMNHFMMLNRMWNLYTAVSF
jgi:hypothetical protein